MPQVAIIIPAFNADLYLARTVQSVLSSTCSDFEIVVIDDGSTDRTAEVAQQIGDPRIRVISQANAGMSASRNRGIEQSDSEYIALLDSDDLWHPLKLEYQLASLHDSPYALSFTEFQPWDGGNDFMPSARSKAFDTSLTGWIYHKMILTNYALPSSVVFRRSLWNETGEFICEDHQTDDWEFLVRASTEFQFVKLKDPFVLYRQHPLSLSKRIPPVNKTELMRDRLLNRYGLCSPQGIQVDVEELERRRYLDKRHFADAHVVNGKLTLGLVEFGKLLASGPRRIDTLATFLKSALKRGRRFQVKL